MNRIASIALIGSLALCGSCKSRDRAEQVHLGTAEGKLVVAGESVELKHAYATRVKNKKTGAAELNLFLSGEPVPEAALFDAKRLESLAQTGRVHAVGIRISADQKATEAFYFHAALPPGLSIRELHELSTSTFTQDRIEGRVAQRIEPEKTETDSPVHYEANFATDIQGEPLALEAAVDPSSSPAQRVRQELEAEGLELDEHTFGEKVGEGDLKTVKRYLAAGMSARTKHYYYGSVLSAALSNGHEDVALALIEAGADVNGADEFGEPDLVKAARSGKLAVVEAMIAAGADVNNRTHRAKPTALMAAAESGNGEVVQALLKAGANIKTRTSRGGSALESAVYGGHIEVARILLDAGAELQRDRGKLLEAADAIKNPQMRAFLEEAVSKIPPS